MKNLTIEFAEQIRKIQEDERQRTTAEILALDIPDQDKADVMSVMSVIINATNSWLRHEDRFIDYRVSPLAKEALLVEIERATAAIKALNERSGAGDFAVSVRQIQVNERRNTLAAISAHNRPDQVKADVKSTLSIITDSTNAWAAHEGRTINLDVLSLTLKAMLVENQRIVATSKALYGEKESGDE